MKGRYEVLFSTHVNHASVSPTLEMGPLKNRKTLTRVGIEPTTFQVRSPLLYRREQVVGIDNFKLFVRLLFICLSRLKFWQLFS